jgi:hypothetical protein
MYRGFGYVFFEPGYDTHDEYTFLNDGLGSSAGDPMEELKQELWVRNH